VNEKKIKERTLKSVQKNNQDEKKWNRYKRCASVEEKEKVGR